MQKSHILLTGAAGNLGRAVVAKLLDRGDRISAILSPSSDSGFVVPGTIKIYRGDLIDAEISADIVRQVIEDSGPVDAGVLMVGGFEAGNLPETGMKDIYRMMDLNFATAYNVARPLFVHMESTGRGGTIIFTGARPGSQPGLGKDMLAYTLSKSLLFSLSEILNASGREKGIGSSVVIPGIIDTPQNRKANPGADFSTWETPGEVAENIMRLLPTGG